MVNECNAPIQSDNLRTILSTARDLGGMRVKLLLCDAAQAVNGKMYILGAGWNLTGPQPSPSALAVQIDVPWDQANHQHKIVFRLVTEDAEPVLGPTPQGDKPVQIEAEFEVGRLPWPSARHTFECGNGTQHWSTETQAG